MLKRESEMDIFTLYVGQGSLAAVRAGDEAIIVDAHMPDSEDVTQEQIERSLDSYLAKKRVRGLILTGLDKDHACPAGVESILSKYQPDWVMYPTYYKDTETASEVFRIIVKHEKRREKTAYPMKRNSVRVDKVDSRILPGLATCFTLELFSPHMDDMDSSNNSSIVIKLTGLDPSGFSYLVTGDTETARWETINRIFGKYISVQVLAAPHHGAISGMHAGMLLSVNPDTVLVSAGVDSSYGHPHGRAISAYQRIAQHVFATNAGPEGTCLFTRRVGNTFETRLVRHFDPVAANA
jgi:beta-lactamase superfamily II metal-dependent hydrolase